MDTFQQVSPQESEVDKAAPPPNAPAEPEPGTGDQDTADDAEAALAQNPSREFLKFANQALQLNVSLILEGVTFHFLFCHFKHLLD